MMKKISTSHKKIVAIGSLSALCIAVLAGTYFLTVEPDNHFTPASTKTGSSTDTWKENADTEVPPSENIHTPENQAKGSEADQTQKIVSEDENGSTSSLSGSEKKKESEAEKPTVPPVTNDDISNPDNQPEYDNTVPQTSTPSTDAPYNTPPSAPPAEKPSDENAHPGQVYDPVFGWIDIGNTVQDTVDSDGDINKQIGSMGGN